MLVCLDERGVAVEPAEAERILEEFDGHVGDAIDEVLQLRAGDPSCDGCPGCDDCVLTDGETLDAVWWNNRFRDDGAGHSDWLLHFEGYGDFLTRHVPKASHTLVPGCGNSPFSAKLHAAGYLEIVNTDISDYVVQ
eukprot:2702665-Prymnesium_polylepis.1